MGSGPLFGRIAFHLWDDLLWVQPPLWEDCLKRFQVSYMADLPQSNLPMKKDRRTAHGFRPPPWEDFLWVQAPSLGGLPKMVSAL